MENMDVDGALKTITDIVKLSESTLRDNSRILTMPVPVQNQNSFQIYNDGGVSTLSTSLLNECNRLTQEEAAAFDSINMSMKSESCAIKVEHEKEEAKTQICSSEQTIHCKFCDQYFSNTDAASKHMQKFHLCCSECNKIFDNRIKLQKHLNYVHHGQIYKCDLCTNTYRSRSGLIKHIRHHVQQHPYTCDECGKGFWDRVPYGEHINQHTQKSNYICEKCGKTFLRMSTYQLHLKYHENSTPFKCKLCPKAYASRSSVVIHRRRVHTGEMPFRCTHCSRQFPTRAAYKIHLIYHTQEYPFLCSVCPSKGFIRRRDYTNHMVKIHQVETTSNTSKLKSFFKVSLRGST